MVEWHHWLHGHEFEQILEDSEGQGSLVSCSRWGLKELDMTEQLNNNKKLQNLFLANVSISILLLITLSEQQASLLHLI